MAKTFVPKSTEQIEKELQEITERVEKGISNFFTSTETVIEHLRFLSQFHDYSVRNMLLMQDQFPGATAVGSFAFWKSKGVNVNKGEKGIKILIPTPVTYFQRGEDMVQLKFATTEEKALISSGKMDTIQKNFFKIGHVFDYIQTNAREKGMPISQIFGQFQINQTVENADMFMSALQKLAEYKGVKLLDNPIEELGRAKGAFYPFYNSIALNPRNTQAENIQVLIHELAHATLHNREKQRAREKPLTTPEKEFQAELTAFAVASHYGIEKENFSIPYLANWTKEATLRDKEQLIQEVKDTASDFIKFMDKKLEKMVLEKTIENEKVLSNITYIGFGDLSKATVINFSNNEFKDYLTKLDAKKYESFINKDQLTNEDLKEINNLLGDSKMVMDPTDLNEPHVFIKYSEHPAFEDNGLVPFAKANEMVAEISAEQKDQPGYYKLRYTVLVPGEEGIEVVPADRLDMGDGEFKDIYHQILKENQMFSDRNVSETHLQQLHDNLKAYHQLEFSQLALTTLPQQIPKNELDKINISEAAALKEVVGNEPLNTPIMKIHGVSDYETFGKANELDLNLDKQSYVYTIAYQDKEDIQVFTSKMHTNRAYTPLDDLEKFEKLDKDTTLNLSESWHGYLQKEEERYLESVVPVLKREFDQHEKSIVKSPKKSKANEMER